LGNYQIRKIAEHFNRDRAVISQDLKKVELRFRGDKDSLTCFGLSAMIFSAMLSVFCSMWKTIDLFLAKSAICILRSAFCYKF